MPRAAFTSACNTSPFSRWRSFRPKGQGLNQQGRLKHNMSKIYTPPLLLTLKPSQKLKYLLIVMHAIAIASSLAAALTIAIKLTLWAGLLVHLGFMLRHVKSQQHILKHTEEFGWELSDGADFESIQILDSTVISTFAIFLHFKTSKKQSLLIISDTLTDDDYRQLIVRLKTQRE